MNITRCLAAAVLAASFGLGLNVSTGEAQIRDQQPAEFPPASYKGKQYVDSNGCVFIRAGIDGDVAWIPRVSRDRKVICGFRPSLAGAVAEAPAPRPVTAPEITPAPEQTAAATAAPAPQAARPAPRRVAAPAPTAAAAKPRVVRQTAPKRQPRVVAAPQPVTVVPQAETRQVVVAGTASPCAGASPISQQYLQGKGVRCGPQAHRITPQTVRVVTPQGGTITTVVPKPSQRAVAAQGTATVAPNLTTETRIIPKHVAENRVNTQNVTVPKGYRPVWEDDRLNPRRAEQSLQGRSDMLLIWTQTVPRRLIDRRTGRDVTAKMPLIYPYTSYAQQQAEVGEVTLVQKDGQLMKRIVRNPGAQARKPVYSTRSAPKAAAASAAKPRQALAQPRYVQVGTYGVSANAQTAAQTIARMGLRARIGKTRSGGRTLYRVEAGPFAEAGSLRAAVGQLRRAGYADAFVK